jgi:hypothetical protein
MGMITCVAISPALAAAPVRPQQANRAPCHRPAAIDTGDEPRNSAAARSQRLPSVTANSDGQHPHRTRPLGGRRALDASVPLERANRGSKRLACFCKP